MILRVGITALLLSLFAVQSLADADDDDREGGIVGTGIAGVITELGSIVVNGHRVVFDPDLPVRDAPVARKASALVPGQTVAVIASPHDEDWHAHSIRQVLPLIGPVDSISEGGMIVLGTRVEVSPDLVAEARPGEWFAISGLWRGDMVMATHLERLDSPGLAQVSGSNVHMDSSGQLTIGGTRVEGISPRHIAPGDAVRAIGRPVADGLRAERLESGLFDGEVGLVQVEGYLSTPTAEGLYTMLGTGLIAFTDQPDMIDPDERLRRCGTRDLLLSGADQLPDTGDIGMWRRLGCGS